MNELTQATLSVTEARSLTDEVRDDAERLWRKLVELYEGEAHVALGYGSWGAYFKAEFGGGRSQAYRILDAGRVARELHSPIGERQPIRESQARELVPLLDEPRKLREAWAEAVDLHPEPTAADVRAAVEDRLSPRQEQIAKKNVSRLWKSVSDVASNRILEEVFPVEKIALYSVIIDDAELYELEMKAEDVARAYRGLAKRIRSVREGRS